MNIVIYLIFYLTLFTLGEVIRSLVFKDQTKIFGVNISVFNPLFFLFFAANTVFFLNFFLPGLNIVYGVWIFSFLILFLKLKTINIDFVFLIPPLIISALLGFSIYGIDFHYDAGFYHLLNQSWIIREKVVFGLSNIMFPLGNQSLYEYLSTLFWISDNFINLHYLNLSFITVFFHFIFEITKNGNSNFLRLAGITITVFGFLDNVGYRGGANGFPNLQHIGKPDITVAVLVIIFNILIINYLVSNDTSHINMKLILFFGIFLIQIKPTSMYILLIIFIHFFSTNFSFLKAKSNFRFIISAVVLNFFWVLKNVITTGCLLFPVSFTCFYSLPWSNQNLVNEANKHYSDAYLPYKIGTNPIEWFDSWREVNVNNQIMINFLLSFVCIYFLLKLFTVKSNKKSSKSFAVKTYLWISLISFFISVPLFRYSYGILSSLILVLVVDRSLKFDLSQKRILNNLLLIIILISPGLVVRGYSYINFINMPTNYIELKIPSIQFTKSQFYGELPIKETLNPNKKCWINVECNPEDKQISKREYFGYVFLSEEND
tara:strand:+ start:1034 stop:2671 length:1638 start_codon:yes stop_codon:yes gene_type:complete